MLKKYYLILWLLIYSCNTQASIWGSIVSCFTDVCNCGKSSITETWNSGTLNAVTKTFKPGALCPPWNKGSGRDQDTCLLQYDYPSTFIPLYMKRCAEATPESNYFAPKIRIRIQSCNALACWTQSTTLNWDGECVLWPTGYALPLTRVCARVAVPAMPAPPGIDADDTPADPGYTEGYNLNSVGYREQDPPIIGSDGQVIIAPVPKLCAYSDPGLLNLISDSGGHLDPMDWNPNSQPLHYTTKLSPVAEVLKFLVEQAGGANLPNLLGQLLNMIGSDNTFLNMLQKIFSAIGEIFKLFPSLIIEVINKLGALNNAVDSYLFGCVNLPLGPFPPPFCPSLNNLTVNPILQNICSQKNSDGTFNQTSVILPCAVSNVRNNIVNNTVRISFNNLIPLCTGNTPDLTTCVQIQGPFSSASGIHTATSFTDIIQPCGTAASGAPCINTKIPLTCSVTANGCNQGFRITYAQVTGNTSTPSDYFISDLPDCNSSNASTSTTCQQILGVNIGEFVDVSVAFPSVQDQNNLTPIQKTFSLKDNNGTNRNFYAQIVNVATSQQSPENICVFESALLINCQPRANSGYNLVTYQCGEHAGLNCSNNTYYTPQFIASIQVRDDKDATNIIDETNTIVTPLSATGSPSSTETEAIVMLAGYAFNSSIAYIPTIPPQDSKDKYIAMPFSGPDSENQLTIYGKYKNNIPPYNKATGAINSNAVYLKYLEYFNGKYIQGGTHACLMPQNFQHCAPLPPPPIAENSSVTVPQPPQNTIINCILAKLTETDKVNCKQFKTIASNTYPNLGMCQAGLDTSSCTSDTSSVSGITIYTCGTTYCYTNNNDADTPVCVLSQNYQDRISPLSGIGPILTDSQYYAVQYDSNNNYIAQNANGNNQTYTTDIADVRDKTFQELNLCVPIPIPNCAAVTENGAIWPQSNLGDLVTGTCQSDWIPIDPNIPLQRYCLSNFDAKRVAFEPLAAGVGCKAPPPAICTTINEKNTIWPETQVNQIATGSCQANFVPIDPKTSLQRRCLAASGNKAVFETLSANAGCKAAPPATCKAIIENGANWPETPIGKTATGTCQDTSFIPIDSSKPLQRRCSLASNNTANFERLNSNIGCRFTVPITFSLDPYSDYPSNYPFLSNYNESSRIGTFEWAKLESNNKLQQNSLLSNDHAAFIDFNINIPLENIEYFSLMKFTINGSYTSILSLNDQVIGDNRSVPSSKDYTLPVSSNVKNYLKPGANIIDIKLSPNGDEAGVYFLIQYKLK